MSYSELKYAVNSTLGTEMFQPLDELVSEVCSSIEEKSTIAFFGGNQSYLIRNEQLSTTTSNEFIFCNAAYKHTVGRKVYGFAGAYVITLDLDTMLYQKLTNFKIVPSANGNLKTISSQEANMGSYHIGNDIYLALGTNQPRLHKYSIDTNTVTEDVFYLPSLSDAYNINALAISNNLRYVYITRTEGNYCTLYRIDLTTNTVSNKNYISNMKGNKLFITSRDNVVAIDKEAIMEFTFTSNTSISQTKYTIGFEVYNWFQVSVNTYAVLGLENNELTIGLYNLERKKFIVQSTPFKINEFTASYGNTIWTIGFNKNLNLLFTNNNRAYFYQYSIGFEGCAKLYLTPKDKIYGDGKLLNLEGIQNLTSGVNRVTKDDVYYYIDGTYLRIF